MSRNINDDLEEETTESSFDDKLKYLIGLGATKTISPKVWEDGLVCVMGNSIYAEAAYAYDSDEMHKILRGINDMNFQWVYLENANELAQ